MMFAALSAAPVVSRAAFAQESPPDSPPPVGEVTPPPVSSTPAVKSDNEASPESDFMVKEKTAEAPAASTREGTAKKSGSKKASSEKNDSDGSPFGAFGNPKRGPVNIQSDTMSLDYPKGLVLFRGHVHAVQADGVLLSDTLDVKYGKDFHDVQEMLANGNVRISQGLRWCTSDHGVLNQVDHTVVLTGSPVCHNGNDQIAGTKITVHLDSNRSEVEGVKAVIFPREGETRDNVNGVHAKQADSQ
jgi:lipopolysaccharide export system protein LptA